MENKYYIPEPSEFYPGFIWEAKFSSGEGKEYTEWWEEQVVTPFHSVVNTCGWVQYEDGKDPKCLGVSREMCRVKYLDQSDIESLGFEYHSEDEFYSKDKEYNIYTGNKNIEIYSAGVCFIGTIKNKSELKRILTMIGYE